MEILSFDQISKRLLNFKFPSIDYIVGIGTGGICPATMIAHQLKKPMEIVTINYRDEKNNIVNDEPIIKNRPNVINNKGLKILLVDDVSVSGKTLLKAKSILSSYDITTFVLLGSKADLVLFPEISGCVNWPW